MTLLPGGRLGPFEITGAIGAGGMGEVFRARDTKLNRDVAIKVLPTAFADDPERLARFTREAQTLASLNHPNIAAIYGIEDVPAVSEPGPGSRALVMELVEGEDLSIHIARGPIPIAEALPIARQIAEALEAAHELGIVHRDLKPANIKVRADGTVKVLDFGLAKAMDPASASTSNPNVSHSPTLTHQGMSAGMIIGTAAYMSPEQAKGKPIDKRTDIWAFGVVMFEMLSGHRLFTGETVSDILAAVLTREVAWSDLPKSLAPRIRQLLGRCLERDPKRRLRDIGEARLALDGVSAGAPGEASDPGSTALARTPRAAWVVAFAATLVALSLWLTGRPAPTPVATVRFDMAWPGDAAKGERAEADYFDLSPDGRHLVIVAAGQIWVRSLDSRQARALAGAEGGRYPFWSPDSNSIGFFAGGELRRIARDGGAAQRLCEARNVRGGAWSSAGTIVFSERGGESLLRVLDRGGPPVRLTQVAARDGTSNSKRYPQFLPDGRRFLFTYLAGSKEVAGVYVSDLDGTPPVRVLDGSDHAFFTPGGTPKEPGHLLFRRGEVLMAQPFDAQKLQLTGEMFPVAERVGEGNTGRGAFAVSQNGALVYSEQFAAREVLTWIDRSGRRLGAVTGQLSLGGFALSPDGRRVAYASEAQGGRRDVWLQAIEGGSPSRFTFGDGVVGWTMSHWTRDGARLVYATQDVAGEARYEVRARRVDRASVDETLVVSPAIASPWDSSPEGRGLLYSTIQGSGVMLLPMEAGAKPALVADGGCCAHFSPDGRFITYAGSAQVFVQPIPPTGALWQISPQGGGMPRWSADGREIYYRSPDGKLMAVPVRAGPGSFEAGTPQALFDGIPSGGSATRTTYQPANDGQRFLVSLIDGSSQSPITVVLNWQGAVRR